MIACPACGRISPPSAETCQCGHRFGTNPIPQAMPSRTSVLSGPIYRGLGVGLIVIAAIGMKFFVFDVLKAAAAGTAQVTVYMKLTILLGMLPAVGLLMIVLGGRTEALFHMEYRKLTAKQVIVLLAVVAPGIAFYFWFTHALGTLGYR